MTGFSGLNSDNTKHSAVGQRICMYADVPTDGSTPEDHDLISNVKYTAEKLYTSRYFRGYTNGTVSAELGMGMSYNQSVYNTRVVKGDKIFTESISSSWAKSVAEQKYINGTRVLYRPSTSVSGKTAKYANSVKDISAKFGELYGLVPNELTKQVLSVTEDPEKDYGITIKSVRDDNASSKQAVNAQQSEADDGDAEDYGFYNPESLTPDKDGNFQYTLTLDPVSATMYSRNETRTMAGSSKNPDYSKESDGSVVVTIKIDKNWYPISVTVRETYGIDIPGIGALICNSSLTETFSEIGNKDIVLPEQAFFESHMGDVGGGDDIPPAELETADYLMYAFGKYISGAENLDLSANLSIGSVDLKNLKLSVNIGTLNIRARYDDLYIEYGKGAAVGRPDDDLVYITLNDIKGYLPVDKATALISDPAVKSLMDMFASGVTLPDLGSLFGEDLMAGMTCEKNDDNVFIHIPLKLEGLATVEATITLKNNESYDLESVSATVEAFGIKIALSAKPAKNLIFETPDKSYVDLSPLVDFVPAAISTVLDHEAYGIKGDITVDGTTVSLDAYVARDGFDGVTVDGTVTILGQELSVQYVNNALYASIGNIGVTARADDVPALVDEISKYVSLDTSTFDRLKDFLPETVGDWINTLQSLSADEHTIRIGLRILGAPITITLTRDGSALTGLALSANVNVLDIKLDAAVALEITLPEKREVEVRAVNYIDANEIPGLIPYILDYASAEALTATVDGYVSFDGATITLSADFEIDIANVAVAAVGKIGALDQTLDVAYVGDTAYIGLGNVKFKLNVSDIDLFVPHIEKLLQAFGIDLATPYMEMPEVDVDIAALVPTILDAVKYVSVKDSELVLKAEIAGASVTLTINVETGDVSIGGEYAGVTFGLDCNIVPCSVDDLGLTVDSPDSYSDVKEFIPTIDAIAELIGARAATAEFYASYGDVALGGTLAIDLNGGLDNLKLKLDVTSISGIDYMPAVTATVTLIGKTVYIEISGTVNAALTASLDDVRPMLESLAAVIPAELMPTIENALDMVADLETTLKDAIKGALENAKAPTVEQIRDLLDSVLNAISLSVADGNLDACVSLAPFTGKDITLVLNALTDLSQVRVDTALDGKTVTAKLYNIASGANITVPDADFISVIEFKPVIDAVMPLVLAEGFEFDVDVTLFGINVSGKITLALPTEESDLAVKAIVMIGDIPLSVIYKDDVLYLDLNNGEIMLKCGTTEADLNALLESVTTAIPQVKDILDELLQKVSSDAFSIEKLLAAEISLYHTDYGFAVLADLNPVGIDAIITLGISFTDGALSGMTVDAAVNTSDDDDKNDIRLDIDLTVELDEVGAISKIKTVDGAKYAVGIEILSREAQTVGIGNTDGYIDLADLTDFLAPVVRLVEDAMTAKSLTINLGALVRTADMKQLTIDGKAEIDFDTMAVRVSLTLFDEKIEITYLNGVLYIKLGQMKLKFTVSGEPNDLARIHAILDEYLPRYLSDELAVLLGISDSDEISAFNDIGLIIDRFKSLGNAKSIDEAAALLFGKLHDYEGAPSAIKTLADMFNLYMRSNTPTIGFALAGFVIDISPVLTLDKSALSEITIDTSIAGMSVHAAIGAPNLSEKTLGIALPENSDAYVSIIDYIELVNNLVHTFTTHDADGNITFSIDTFAFSYKENDKTVQNDDGTESVVAGKTVTVGGVTEGGAALPVLKGKLVKTEKGGYDINLEAHLKLDGVSENGGSLTLAFYILSGYYYGDTLYDKVAFLSYKESKTGYGENISIDYGSVMQILASVFKILGVNDETLNLIIPAEYRVDIDSGVFDSLDIVGMDGIRDTIENIVALLINLGDALDDVKSAWDLVLAPDGMTGTREEKINALLGSTDQIKEHIANAIGRFKSDEEATPEAPELPDEYTEIEVPEFSDIVNGISLTADGGELGATVSNSLTTKGKGTAELKVSQGVNESGKGVVNGVAIKNLDVNTAVIEYIDVDFTSGGEVVIAPDMNALINVTDEKNKTSYSDLSNIKHLLFDLLNTANLMEFRIGGVDTSDTITLNISVIGLDLVTVDIHYDVKVKLYSKQERIAMGLLTAEQAQDPDEPEYKTAAYVELNFKDCTALSATVVGDLSTRLYFYDNMLYVDGVKSWNEEEIKYGSWLFPTKKKFFNCNRVYAQYTVDEFLYMISNDIEKFLNECLFYLVPLSTKFTVFGINLQSAISSAITAESKAVATPTIATVFKGYTYDNGKHSITIGLKELTGNNSLNDLNVSLTGANDGDDNLLDNYISGASIDTKFASVVVLSLNATLRNADTSDPYNMVSSGLGNATIYNDHWYVSNNSFVFDGKDVTYTSLEDLLKGELPITGGNENPWTRIWKDAYDAAQAA